MNRLKQHKELIGYTFLILSILYFYFPYIFIQTFWFDSIRFLSVSNIENVFSIEYFIKVFSKGTNGPQYRPLSFFISPLITGYLFGQKFWLYQLVGLMHIAGILYILNKIFKFWNFSLEFRLFGLFLYALHPIGYLSFGNVMFSKYYLTTIILLYGIYILSIDSKIELKKFIILFLLQSFAIMLHEGSIAFIFVWTVVYFVQFNSKIEKKFFGLFIPVIFYSIMRFLVHRAPKQGFMKVSLEGAWERILFYYSNAWEFFHHMGKTDFHSTVLSYNLFKFFLFFILALICLKKKKDSRPIQLICFSLIVCLPFSLLPNHVVFNRSFWAYPFFVLCFLIIIQTFIINKKILYSLMSLILILVFYSTYQSRNNTKGFIGWKEREFLGYFEKVKEKTDTIPENQIFILDSTLTHGFDWHLTHATFPTILAMNLPKRTFVVRFRNEKQLKHILIHKGGVYEIQAQNKNSFKVTDLYYIQHEFSFKSETLPLDYIKSPANLIVPIN